MTAIYRATTLIALFLSATLSGQARQNSAASAKPADHSSDRIGSRVEFDKFARIYYRGRFFALPHVMFVIDRRAQDRVYYIDSKLFPFHKDFVNATYLSLDRGTAFYENNYLKSDRRFILGTVAYQSSSGKYTYEFWEGDLITKQLLEEAYQALAQSFFAPLYFKPNSLRQEEATESVRIDTPDFLSLTPVDISKDSQYEPLNSGAGIGQLRIIDQMTPDTVIDRNQIVIFKQVPVHLPPLSGIITTEPASPLSHINMLAKSWAIPNAYIKNADKLFRQLEGKYVSLHVKDDDYQLMPANLAEVEKRQRQWVIRADQITPPADLGYTQLTDLKDQRARDAIRFGAKSANLGELLGDRVPELNVPPGFTIPFHHYREFLRRNGLEERIRKAVEEDRFVHDPKYRKSRLAEIRKWIETGMMDGRLSRIVLAKAHQGYAGKGLFARSSTNAEDLANFSGAGLYTTVPNARTSEQLIQAIKTVWASVWNYEAYEARESFGMNHFGVYMAVLIQEGISADSAGVAITTDPFNRIQPGFTTDPAASPSTPGTNPGTPSNAVYINAKRGLGMKVVEGRRVAEQVIYRPDIDSVQVLTRSDEDTMLAFNEKGGIKEVKVEQQRAVLTDSMVRRLAQAAIQIKRVFAGRDQDIEWVYAKSELFIVQSRPYIPGN